MGHSLDLTVSNKDLMGYSWEKLANMMATWENTLDLMGHLPVSILDWLDCKMDLLENIRVTLENT
jgi:hypothetical protein